MGISKNQRRQIEQMQPILALAYADYNTRFFDSKLPICILEFSELPFSEQSIGTLARTTRVDDIEMIPSKILNDIPIKMLSNIFVTQLDYRLAWNELLWRPTLLHEMNHISLYDEPNGQDCHSSLFLDGIKSLISHGAYDNIL